MDAIQQFFLKLQETFATQAANTMTVSARSGQFLPRMNFYNHRSGLFAKNKRLVAKSIARRKGLRRSRG